MKRSTFCLVFTFAVVLTCSFSRYSMNSNSDLTHQNQTPYDSSTVDSTTYSPRPRHDSNTLLMLPAPLAVNRPMMSSSSTVGARSSEDNYVSDSGTGPHARLISTPQTVDNYSYSEESAQRLVSPTTSAYDSPYGRATPPQPPPTHDPQNPFRSQSSSPYPDNSAYMPEYEDPRHSSGRGVQLADGGPVPGPDGVRRVSRQPGRRPSSQVPQQQNRYSRSSMQFNLPPGAAPPQPNYGPH